MSDEMKSAEVNMIEPKIFLASSSHTAEIEEAAEKTTPPRVWSFWSFRNEFDDGLLFLRKKFRTLYEKFRVKMLLEGSPDEPSLHLGIENKMNRNKLNNLIDELEKILADCTDNKSFNRVGKNGNMSSHRSNKRVRKEIVQRYSSLLLSVIVFLGISYIIWSSLLSIINVHPMQKEHDHRLSVWPSLLGLFGYMVFVCAVAAMILVGAPFTSMQTAMIIFWAILMHLQLANSIMEVFITLVCGLFMELYMLSEKKQPPNEVI